MVGIRLSRVLSWWLGELAAMLPARLRDRRIQRQAVLLTAAEAVVTRDGAELGRFHDRRDLARALAGPVALRLPPGRAVRRMVPLPAAAEDNLRQVLAFEMDRQTPWAAADVVYACRVVAREPARRRIEAEMVVAPRVVVEEALALARRWGVTPDTVEAGEAAAGGLDLLPPGSRRRRDWAGRLSAAVVALAVLGVAAAGLAGIDRRRDAAQLRRLDREDADARFLASRKSAFPPMVAVIDELTRVLPDNAWIGQLEVAGGGIEVIGWSPSATEVVRRMEEAALFHHAEFRSPLLPDPGQGMERFHVAARLAGGAP